MDTITTTEELWERIRRLIAALRRRGGENIATQIEQALRSNTGLTDGWSLMLDGLTTARTHGEAHLTIEERAELDRIIDAVRNALQR